MTMEISAHSRYSKRVNQLTIGVSVLVSFVLLITHQYFSGHQQLLDELQTEAAIIGTNSAAALVFRDEPAAHESLASIRHDPRILSAAFYLEDGSRFVAHPEASPLMPDSIDSTRPFPALALKTSLFSGSLQKEVTHGNARVGTLLLHFSYKKLYLNLLEFALGLALTSLIALYLARRFTSRLRKKVLQSKVQLEKMALYDRVTNLPNRRFFEYELKRALTRIQREDEDAVLFMIDVDDFKKVNDLCGHLAGDQVLMMLASRLKKTVRADDVVARIGGDEFAAILFKVGGPENAHRIAEKMIEAITLPFPTEPAPSHVGLSIGMTMLPCNSNDPATLIRRSDMAMYEAKSRGKNRAQFFSDEINHKVQEALEIEAELRRALQDPDTHLHVVYQPQACAKTGEIIGAEALIRWKLGSGRFVPPSDFIPVAEKTGLILEIGAWIVAQSCHDLAEMQQNGIDIPKIAINVSPRELIRGSIIVEKACLMLKSHGLSVDRVQFELTENALMDKDGAEVLQSFRAAGFSLAIDDFGSGYSSLGYLKRFQVSALKIDRQFVQHLPANRDDATIVSAVIQMAKALGITVVAEGVETQAQADFLAAHGCDILQGYFISRPIPKQELVAFIKTRKSSSEPAPEQT